MQEGSLFSTSYVAFTVCRFFGDGKLLHSTGSSAGCSVMTVAWEQETASRLAISFSFWSWKWTPLNPIWKTGLWGTGFGCLIWADPIMRQEKKSMLLLNRLIWGAVFFIRKADREWWGIETVPEPGNLYCSVFKGLANARVVLVSFFFFFDPTS